MRVWLDNHYFELATASVVVCVALVAGAIRRWWLLIPIPAFLAALAWYGWEFSADGGPLAAGILILTYGALGIGIATRRVTRKR